MPAGKALTFLIIALAVGFSKIAGAQAPARHALPAPNGASPRVSTVTDRPAPTPAKPTAPISPADAARPAPISAEPAATTATYGDWLLRCQQIAVAGATTQQICDVTQTVQAQGQQNPLLQLSFGLPGPKEPIKLTIAAPVNVSFPSVALLAIDRKRYATGRTDLASVSAWRIIAELEIKDELLKRWRAQIGGGVVKIVDAAGREIAMPFSFRGLAQALDALPRS